eukprot:m.6956 g.6956  ORF g.6956 m.6956 type:complete len:1269 (+) comp2778_c0_seq1:454-4260(+)
MKEEEDVCCCRHQQRRQQHPIAMVVAVAVCIVALWCVPVRSDGMHAVPAFASSASSEQANGGAMALNAWTAVEASSPVPQPRFAAGAVQLEASAGEAVLYFGGFDISGHVVSNAWFFKLKSSVWVKVDDPPEAFEPRAGFVVARETKVVGEPATSALVFGGFGAHGVLFNNVWRFDAAKATSWEPVWTEEDADAAALPGQDYPTRRSFSGGASLGDECLVIFGGVATPFNYSEELPLGDTWGLDTSDAAQASARWHRIDIGVGGPSPSARFGFGYASFNDILYVSGGCDLSPNSCMRAAGLAVDLWAFRLNKAPAAGQACASGVWRRLANVGPAAVFSTAALGGSPTSPTFYRFGGFGLSDATGLHTYTIDLTDCCGATKTAAEELDAIAARNSAVTWASAQPAFAASQPARRFHASSIFINVIGTINAVARDVFLLLGGTDGFALQDTMWVFDNSVTSWFPLDSTVAPTNALGAAATRINNTVFLNGGVTAADHLSSDLWQLDTTLLKWTLTTVETSAPPTYGHRLIAGPDDVVLSVGGSNMQASVFCDDVWPLWGFRISSGSWFPVGAFTGHGTARGVQPPCTVYQSAELTQDKKRLFVFGGFTYLYPLNLADWGLAIVSWELWMFQWYPNSFAQGSWTQVQANNTDLWPVGRAGHASAMFADTQEMLIYGGYSSQHTVLDDVWLFHVDRLTWRQVPLAKHSAAPRLFGMQYVQLPRHNQLLVQGGLASSSDSGQESLSSSWLGTLRAHPEAWQWSSISAPGPQSAMGAAVVASDDMAEETTVAMFGGTSFYGRSNVSLVQLSNGLSIINITCEPGHYSDQGLCSPCPVGTYSEDIGPEPCTVCPSNILTAGVGSVALSQCDTCPVGCCEHGRCSVGADLSLLCSCNAGYIGSTCQIPALTIGLIAAVVALVVAGVVAFVYRRKHQRVKLLEHESLLHAELLELSQQQVDKLTEVWRIDHSEIILGKAIGEGGFGEVYRAEWQGRDVAVKFLKDVVAQIDDLAVDDFQREVQFLLEMKPHRNIVYFYGAGFTESQVPFLVTEFCELGSVTDVLRTQAHVLDWKRRCTFAMDAANGLEFLHGLSPPCVHRDVKPRNLLVNNLFVTKLADFGTSKLCKELQTVPGLDSKAASSVVAPFSATSDSIVSSRNATQEMTGVVGTLTYCAPEVFSKEHHYSVQVDVYSLGIVMWEVWNQTVRPLYDDLTNSWDLREAVIGGRRPMVDESWPAPYAALMQACWDHDPSSRPLAGHVADVISGWLESNEFGLDR